MNGTNKISRMLGLARHAINHPREVMGLVKKNYTDAKDSAAGKAVSHARLIRGGRFIPEVMKFLRPYRRGEKFCLGRRPKGRGPALAVPILGARIRMLDGKVYQFFSDGSLRHAFGRQIGKLARKALKRRRTRERVRSLPLLAREA